MTPKDNNEHWGSRVGVILAVAGSAVGIGNFLRFPGQAAMNGGGTFMIPYLISLLIVALPLATAEWALGRHGGRLGFHSPMGIYYAAGGRRPFWGVFGGSCLFIAFIIDMYYLLIEAWCLVYALQYLGLLCDKIGLGFTLLSPISGGAESMESCGKAFEQLSGIGADGAMFSTRTGLIVLAVLAFCVFANFHLIYRGVSKGIERFCKMVAPLILLCSIFILVRVFTLGNPTGKEGQSLLDGLGFMWNPQNLDVLKNPAVWLAATSQIFFSTSICTSAVCTYTSYIESKQDVALSSVTATMTNEFCEVCLGGMMIVPPAIMFLGSAAADKIGSSFSLGFVVLPNVFEMTPAGSLCGFVFFSLLFFSAITSSISQLQPAVVFMKEAYRWSHKKSVLFTAALILIGTAFICYFTKGLTSLDTFDFWGANLSPFICALGQTILISFIWKLSGLRSELDRGALIKLPRFIGPLIKYVSLPYLAIIFAFWLRLNFSGHVENLVVDRTARISTFFLAAVFLFIFLSSCFAVRRWKREEKEAAARGETLAPGGD